MMPIIGVSVIIYILVINIPATSPPITYEINTLSELCENMGSIFGGYDLEVYQNKVRKALSSDILYTISLENQYIENIMWNNKINPVLHEPIRQHVTTEKYLRC